MSGVLEGVVVLDLTRFLSGPHCTLLLAGMGAEVIKIDEPAHGDPTAAAPPLVGPAGVAFERATPGDYGIAYLKRARGKQSVTLDLKQARGRDIFLRLAERADVVVENFRPGVAARLGIDPAALAQRNPRLVHCALSGYGATGPDRGLKSYDLMAQAACGLMSITGEPGGAPVKTGGALSDMIAGSYAALGIAGALLERERSGRGQSVDVAMADVLFSMLMDEPLDCYARLGLDLRQGNRIMRFSPFNTYAARDGWVAIGAATDAEWRALLRALAREDLLEHPDWRRVAWRLAHNAQVDALVGDWAAARAVADIVALLGAADVPCSPVRTPQEAIDWPQLRARGMVGRLARPGGEPTEVVAAGFPMQFSRSSASHDRPAPVPGAQTGAVLARFLGMSRDELAELARAGVV